MAKEKILITGGAGFVGHHCINYILKNTDWDIVVLDSLNYAGNMNRLMLADNNSFNSKRLKFVWHDLRAPISETTHYLLGNLDYCVHFAAESHVDRSLKDSIPFVMANVLGTANLLEYFKHYQPSCKTIIFSSDEVFGSSSEGVCFTEEDKPRPSNPYAASKAAQEMIASSFAHSFSLPISIVRSNNIIGERQNLEKFVPKTIKSILNNEKVVIHGSREELISRNWVPAENVADALLFLFKNAKNGESYNIVGEEKTVLEMANLICKAIKGRDLNDGEIQFIDPNVARPGIDRGYRTSGEKLAKMGWKPQLNLELSLKKIVDWTIGNKQWLDS